MKQLHCPIFDAGTTYNKIVCQAAKRNAELCKECQENQNKVKGTK
jgi:hypothetical protein